MIFKTSIKLSIVCTVLLFISACDSFKNDNINTICEEHAELCDDLHVIMDCRFKRTGLIRARFYDKIEPNETHKLALLNELDEYQSCLELTLFLEFTRNKQRKQQRLDNFLHTQALMQKELKAIKGTQDPILAYYLWTHFQDLQARRVFLKAAQKEDVSDPNLLFKLAIVNSKEAPQEALNTFYKALKVSHSMEQIPYSNFALIMTLFYQHKQFEQAYIWALITEQEDEENEYPINLDLILQKGQIGSVKLIRNEEALALQAEDYYEQLESGTFNVVAPLLKLE